MTKSEVDSLPKMLDLIHMIIYNAFLTSWTYYRHDPMLVLEINPIVGFVANYLCVFLGYLGKVLYYKALTGSP